MTDTVAHPFKSHQVHAVAGEDGNIWCSLADTCQPLPLKEGRILECATTLVTGAGQEEVINGFLNGARSL